MTGAKAVQDTWQEASAAADTAVLAKAATDKAVPPPVTGAKAVQDTWQEASAAAETTVLAAVPYPVTRANPAVAVQDTWPKTPTAADTAVAVLHPVTRAIPVSLQAEAAAVSHGMLGAPTAAHNTANMATEQAVPQPMIRTNSAILAGAPAAAQAEEEALEELKSLVSQQSPCPSPLGDFPPALEPLLSDPQAGGHDHPDQKLLQLELLRTNADIETLADSQQEACQASSSPGKQQQAYGEVDGDGEWDDSKICASLEASEVQTSIGTYLSQFNLTYK